MGADMNQSISTSDNAAAYGALLLRVALGVMWIAHSALWLLGDGALAVRRSERFALGAA